MMVYPFITTAHAEHLLISLLHPRNDKVNMFVKFKELQSFARARRGSFVFLLGICACAAVHSEGFEILSRPEQLDGTAIVKAGNISRFHNSSIQSSDPFSSRQSQFFQLGLYCFQSPVGEDPNGKAALITIDRYGSTSVAFFSESIGSIKLATYPVALYDCVSLMRQQSKQILDDLNRQSEALKRQQELLEQLQKSLRQGRKGSAP